jgi:outer membrane protein TolC
MSCARRRLLPLLTVALALAALAAAPAAWARTYTLPQLIELARRSNPGLAAGAQATASIEAQLLEAKRSWMPTGELVSLLAPVPEIRCADGGDGTIPTTKSFRENHCLNTPASRGDVTISFKGVFTRTELRLVQPLFTFGKIEAGRIAAEQGVAASRDREAGQAADIELNVKKAYYGLKMARAVLETLDEGKEHLDSAQKRIEKELAEGTGSVTQTDRLRLNTVAAEVEVRRLESQRLAELALSGLRALIGPDAPGEIDIDPEPLEAITVPSRPLAHYQEQARLSRPEVRALDHFVASKRALADLERRKQYPDLVLLGTATYAYANSIDNPQNAFYNDPFNTLGAGLAAGLRMPLDLGVRNARAVRLKAEAEEAAERRREALGGIDFEVKRAYSELEEAGKRLQVVRKGERSAKSWVTAVTANFATGLAEAKEISDALVAFFQFRVRSLQTAFDINMAAATLARATGTEVAGGGIN